MPRTLGDWLEHIERQHTRAIDLGLERVRRVAERLRLAPADTLITVGGTNGKGSTCAMLERVLRTAGYRVGLYTSPHLLRFNERIRIAGEPAGDDEIAEALEAVEAARADTPLTYFEFATLAGAWLFSRARLDAAILEVGMGGRLDAVNAFEPDCAAVTCVDLDHMEYLGPDRESIGFEKAGIFRAGRPAIVGEPAPPESLLRHAQAIGADLRRAGRDFGFEAERHQWQYWSRERDGSIRRTPLAYPGLRGARQLANAATAIAALESLRERLPVGRQELRRGLIEVEWPGRFQVLPGRPAIVLDVSHNPQAAGVLADHLGDMGYFGTTWAVFGMLRDKDIDSTIERVRHRVDRWLCATLEGPRGAAAGELAARLARAEVIEGVEAFGSPRAALAHARERAGEGDRIVVFGSFLTVAEAMRELGLAAGRAASDGR